MQDNLSHTDVCLLLDFYSGILTERQKELLALYYNDDWSLSEIAETDGSSRQAIHSVIRRGVDRLLEIEHSLGLVKQHRELNVLLQEIIIEVENNNCDDLKPLIVRLDQSLNRSQEGES
ncbi:MAG: sigma factor-like helix-turn-helix DNA-binding protein [Eubacteriales bacterium]|nr:sigma factor-like helix-turn-helix DNA-binding protein [Eubacteriales bacterium]MDD4323560.1 sigma factor-like helix-turn-helix DNA-binding protein [Eubacteriales bacterium]MDD4541561.1 sigma factor-like helix-turn-helix DNA-binding protein [Eubacteriales bacterium]